MAHEHQERYSALVLAKMRAENILKDGIVFNNDYEGSPKAGAVKIPVRDGEVTVGDYNKKDGADLSMGSTAYTTLTINRDKVVNELIDGYDAEAVPDNMVADRLDSAGYMLARTVDNDGASVLLSEGTRVNVGTIGASTIYSEIVKIRTMMSKANVPNDGKRYLLVTPDVYACLLGSELFVSASNLGDEIKQSGALGRIAGFNVYEWNDSTANLAMIAGHPRYATRANEWSVPVAVNNLADGKHIGASAVQGRMVFAHKVLRKSAILSVFAAGSLTLAQQGAVTDGKARIGVAETATSAFVYRVNPAKRAVADENFTAIATSAAFTPDTTEIACSAGDIIEIIDLDSKKHCVRVGYVTVS